jgi:transcriptional regulator with XRE-family HTH domain
MVTSSQLRAARGLLDWTIRELAERAGVHHNTVYRAENGATDGYAIDRMVRTLEDAGVAFTNHDEPGVKLRKP